MVYPFLQPLKVSLKKFINSKNNSIMKKSTVNQFAISGFVGRSEVRQFASNSKVSFSIAVVRTEKSGEESTRITSFLPIEAWRPNAKVSDFDILKKGAHIEASGYMRPETWQGEDGTQHSRIVMVATKFSVVEADEADAEPSKESGKKGE